MRRRCVAAPGLAGVTRPHRRRCDETKCWTRAQHPAHSPCSRPHARLAGRVATDRRWALTPPFQPSPATLRPRRRACLLLRL